MYTPLHPANEKAVFCGVSEFGRCMAECVLSLPESQGAVLCDALGDPIDFSHRTYQISELDIQLCGAQLTQAIHGLSQACGAVAMLPEVIMIEATRGTLLCTELSDEFLLSLLMRPHADLQRAMLRFEGLTGALIPLLS